MGQKDHQQARMCALDEALRRMVRTCPAPAALRSAALRLAARPAIEPVKFPRSDGR